MIFFSLLHAAYFNVYVYIDTRPVYVRLFTEYVVYCVPVQRGSETCAVKCVIKHEPPLFLERWAIDLEI